MESNKPTVFIITSTYNQLEDTKRLLSSIKRLTYPQVITYIVDDGSVDGTEEYIKKNYPKVIILHGDGTLWWTGAIFLGVNEIIKIAKKGDYILTINNDCTFGKDYLTYLVKASQDNKKAIVGSLVVDNVTKSHIIDAGVRIDWGKYKFISLGPAKIEDLPRDVELQKHIDTLSTKGTLYPVEVFKKIGNFDKKHLPHYISDYEFACRAKKAGFTLLLSYQARVYNDSKRTGFGENIPRQINFRQFYCLLFSRPSRINIVDHFWFIHLCCPARYKIHNYILLILKSLYLLSKVYPFTILRNCLSSLSK